MGFLTKHMPLNFIPVLLPVVNNEQREIITLLLPLLIIIITLLLVIYSFTKHHKLIKSRQLVAQTVLHL